MLDGCLEKTGGNRFDLVLIAAKRTHQLNSGSHKTTLEPQGDKPNVIALREIEAGLIDASILEENYSFDMGFKEKDAKKEAETIAEIENELSEQVVGEDSGLSEITE